MKGTVISRTVITHENTLLKRILVVAVLVGVLLSTAAAHAQNKSSLEQRIAALESKIAELEHKVDELQKTIHQLSLSNTPQTPNPVKKGNWKNISNWRTGLQKGMTKEQVKVLMGEPNKIDAYTLLGEDWIYGYQGSGEIHFSPKGVLESWKEPIPDDLK